MAKWDNVVYVIYKVKCMTTRTPQTPTKAKVGSGAEEE
jgi:hypothetical protein